MFFVAVLCIVIPAFGQKRKFISEEGKIYQQKELDSIWSASGSGLRIVFNDPLHRDTIRYVLHPIQSSDIRSKVYCERCFSEPNKKKGSNDLSLPSWSKTWVTSFKPQSRIHPRIPRTNGLPDLSKMNESIQLTKEQEILLVDVLNHFAPEKRTSTSAMCYLPHNAVVFTDSADEVIGYIEICFDCQHVVTIPAHLKIDEFFDDKFDLLKELFMLVGIKYGVVMGFDYTTKNDSDYKEDQTYTVKDNRGRSSYKKLMGFDRDFGQDRILYEYDAAGNLVREVSVDENGNLKAGYTDIAIEEYQYDENKNRIETRYLGENGKLIRSNFSGSAIVKCKYDKYKNRIEVSYYDENNAPFNGHSGAAIVRYKYDKHQNLIEEAYYDKNDTPLLDIAKIIYVYDKSGEVIREDRFDGTGKIVKDW